MKKLIDLPMRTRMRTLEFKERERAAGEADNLDEIFTFTVSSEEPVETYYPGVGPVLEILSHDPSAIDSRYLDAGIAVTLCHDRYQFMGAGQEWAITEERQLQIGMRWSDSPEALQARKDVMRKLRRLTSLSFAVYEAQLEKKGDREKGELDVYRATRWMPYETTFEPVPADVTVGVRTAAGAKTFPATIEDGDAVMEETRAMDEKEKAAKAAADAAAAAQAASNGGVAVIEERNFTEEAVEILAMCTNSGKPDLAPKFIKERTRTGDVAKELLALSKMPLTAQPSSERLGIPKGMKERYSFTRAINSYLAARENTGKFDGAEREFHDHVAKHLPVGYSRKGGVFVPMILDEDAWYDRQERAMASNATGKGVELVVAQPGEFIDLLYPRTLVFQMGATVLVGLGAPVEFAKQTAGMAFYWLGENPGSGVTASDLALGLSYLAPKTIMGKGVYSRQLIAIGNRSIEEMFRREIAGGHGRAIDRSAIHGLGAAGEPTGIYATPGVGTTAMGSVKPTFGKLIDMQTGVANKFADDGALGYMSTPGMAGALRQTLIASAAGSDMIWKGKTRDGEVAGEVARATGQVSSVMSGLAATGGSEHGVIFGDWNQVIFGSFVALEITVDPFTLGDTAMLVIRSFGMEDVLIRRPESFNVSTAATLS